MGAMKILRPYKHWCRVHPEPKAWQPKRYRLALMQLVIVLSPFLALPSQAAERIIFSLGAGIERSISVDSLEAYVEEGRVTDELAPYIGMLKGVEAADLAQVRALLSQRADIDATTVAQFAYTPQGEFLLNQIGSVFSTGARLSGSKGLRGAAILAAADTEGLTILNLIRRFPTPVLRIDIRRGLAIASNASSTLNQSSIAIDLVEERSFQSASEPFPAGVTAASLNELVARRGPYTVSSASIRLKATGKPVDMYLPSAYLPISDPISSNVPGLKYPAVVISHGVGSDRTSYAYLAQFLASHGFAVFNIEHPGSSAEQLDAFVAGRVSQIPDEEFISRPQLVTEVLNALELQATSNKNLGAVDFNNVGVIGQSFGGYTALAVAGAPLNLESLRNSCPPNFGVNISLLLQCQALAVDASNQRSIEFRDPRVKAAFAINPIASAIFNEAAIAQIDIPTLVMTSSADTIAPALTEQIRPFTWLKERDRYLVLLEGATHFSTIGPTGTETFDLPPSVIGPVPEVAREYTQVMSLAFLSTYLNDDTRYQPILTSAFTTRFSRPEMPLSIITDLPGDQLTTRLRAAAELSQNLQQALDNFLNRDLEGESLPQQRLESQFLLDTYYAGQLPQ